MSLRRRRNPRNAAAPTASTSRAGDPRLAGQSMLRTGTASNATAVQVVDFRTPAPLAVATTRALEALYGRAQRGTASPMSVRWGMGTARYNGYVAPMQRFYGGQGVGNSASIRSTSMRGGLPSSTAVGGQPLTTMQLLLATNDAINGVGGA